MLTDTALKALKPKEKIYRKADSEGLQIEVRTTGRKYWRFKYRFNGKQTLLALGEYPAVGLRQARDLRDQAKALLAQGIDPNQHKKEQKQANKAAEVDRIIEESRLNFTQLFEQWHSHNSESWSYAHSKDIHERIEKHLLPTLGNLSADDIKPKDLIRTLKRLEEAGTLETLKRVKQYASRIFRYGVGMGLCDRDPTRDLPNDIFKKQEKGNYPHLTGRADLHQLLNAIDSYVGDYSTQIALKLAPHLFLRPNELAGLRWDEVDLKHSLITITAQRMKMKRPHLVPLSKQSLEMIKQMRNFSTGDFVFPSPRTQSRPINEQSLNAGLHRIGFKGRQTAHGFRHTASTLLNEMGFNSDHIEKQLAHEQVNKIRGTYNKAEYLPERVKMMQVWSDHLDAIKSGGDVVSIYKKDSSRH
ncbi:tyrosine-type recombinase/integrase [Thiomicrorhabdus sp. zzn3]|uniref:tyrosine-type recombinase/integrase n=1 Tax=Thiomicrorhabdus sp. zzn3 TaxID=3039775 RepID=UPI002436D068|nr:integrase arm-type DNA-binding domain-containing protein [Thiomicrorhabdus sp. zzn3]MDG6777675.1 tyrosine-type recombinase/integrase [Thiomicrorhabdus sp. zzn3]